MEEYKRQLENNLRSDIYEFNNKQEFAKIREFYKMHFEEIANLIKKTDYTLAVEDISNIDASLCQSIHDNRLLLKEINKAIFQHELTLKDIK
ncbi:MAG: hypothetical protein IPJ81_06390 [Chitinophagaceae bacterium]|nr:hypothetical protein [Chitinophagaceae bacterium]